jgi:hypothetical protein
MLQDELRTVFINFVVDSIKFRLIIQKDLLIKLFGQLSQVSRKLASLFMEKMFIISQKIVYILLLRLLFLVQFELIQGLTFLYDGRLISSLFFEEFVLFSAEAKGIYSH